MGEVKMRITLEIKDIGEFTNAMEIAQDIVEHLSNWDCDVETVDIEE